MALALTKIRFSGDSAMATDRASHELIVDVAWDNSYPTGGEVFDVSTWFAAVDTVQFIESDAAAEGLYGDRVVAHDKGTAAAGVLLIGAEDDTSGIYAQVADMTDLSAITAMRLKVTGTLASNYSAAAPVAASNLGAY